MAKPLRVHWLEHAAHEDSGCIGPWLRAQPSIRATRTRLYAGERPPPPRSFDWLIVMGGPMNIYEHERYPWLVEEKSLIHDACVSKKVLGICLGAQLLAAVLGGKVTRNRWQEIGWFGVTLTSEASKSDVLMSLPPAFEAFHWHGDQFSMPPGCRTLITSDACVNQAFQRHQRLVGLQFHLEVRASDARRWLRVDAPKPERYVQSPRQVLAKPGRFAANNRFMRRILEGMREL